MINNTLQTLEADKLYFHSLSSKCWHTYLPSLLVKPDVSGKLGPWVWGHRHLFSTVKWSVASNSLKHLFGRWKLWLSCQILTWTFTINMAVLKWHLPLEVKLCVLSSGCRRTMSEITRKDREANNVDPGLWALNHCLQSLLWAYFS